jgi:hypothetical protein
VNSGGGYKGEKEMEEKTYFPRFLYLRFSSYD